MDELNAVIAAMKRCERVARAQAEVGNIEAAALACVMAENYRVEAIRVINLAFECGDDTIKIAVDNLKYLEG